MQIPVTVLNDDGTEVADSSEYGEVVKFCYDTIDNDENIQRKLIRYELKAYPSSPQKRVLKEKFGIVQTVKKGVMLHLIGPRFAIF